MIGQRAEHSRVVAEGGEPDARSGQGRGVPQKGELLLQNGGEHVGAGGKSAADDDQRRIDDEKNRRKACRQGSHLALNAGLRRGVSRSCHVQDLSAVQAAFGKIFRFRDGADKGAGGSEVFQDAAFKGEAPYFPGEVGSP